MSRDNWFRHSTWNKEIEAAFETKLKRARSKEQYLRIQALSLAQSHPQVSLELLDRYFSLGADFVDCASAHQIRAEAYLALGRTEDAIASYEAALRREAAFPNYITTVAVEYPYLVATRGLKKHFQRALQVLDANRDDIAFPVNRFRWNAARALILAGIGSEVEARSAGRLALDAAAEQKSGFRYHQNLGLVSNEHADVIHRLRRYCDA